MKDCESCVHKYLSPMSDTCRKCGIAMLNYEEAKPKPITNTDRFRVEEMYNWRDDVMEITRRIVHETDEARLTNIAEHFEVDLSEIREFIEMKQQQQRKPQTNAERLTRWEGQDENGPRAVMVNRDGNFAEAFQAILRKLATYEDEDERRTAERP